MARVDMKKTLYLHIGSSKTGTTALQEYLNSHRSSLRQKGYLYPETEFINHHPLARSIIKKFSTFQSPSWKPYSGDAEQLWGKFKEEVLSSDCTTVILSSEEFRFLAHHKCRDQADKMIRWLGEQLEGLDVKVICYLREMGEYVQSQYKQHVQATTTTLSLTDHLEYNIDYRSHIVAPTVFLDLFAQQFGSDKLILRRYNKKDLINENIIDDFIDATGLPSRKDNFQPKKNNPSLPDSLVDTKRIFNAFSGITGRENWRVGNKMTNAAAKSFASRPADNGADIIRALQKEHDLLSERYSIDLGQVEDPFECFQKDLTGEQERAEMVLLSLLWKEIRQLEKKQKQMTDDAERVTSLKERLGHLERLVDRRTSVRQRAKALARRMRAAFKRLVPAGRGD